MDVVQIYIERYQQIINETLESQPPWKIVLYTSAATYAFFKIKEFLVQDIGLYERTKLTAFKLLRKLPMVQKQVTKQISEISGGMKKEMDESINNDEYLRKLPQKGITYEEVLEKAKLYANYGKYNWKTGCASGSVYNGEDELTQLVTDVYGLTVWTNPLHADVFPGIRKMEAEVVRMCCHMFHGSPQSCGSMTTGGTESIVMACKAYRDYAVKVKGIKHPEMVVPVTAHAAFDKASQILNMKIKHAPIDPKSMQVDLNAMRKMITKRTCMIVGSSPQFPHGVIDPIEDLAKLALEKDIPLHVDACLGGFLIAFMEEAGFRVPKFDFRVKGVTSISCDTHKYGFTPKGSSVILYSESKYRHHQFFVMAEWPGGIYATPTLAGSRPGAIIAATWASLVYYGRQGYIDTTTKIIQTAQLIERQVRQIEGLTVMGKPQVSVVAFKSEKFNILSLSDKMTERGWNLNALQYPSCIHIAVTLLHTKPGVVDRFIKDLSEITNKLLQDPPQKLEGNAAIYGLAQSIPDRSIVDEVAWAYLDCCYDTTSSSQLNGKTH